MKCYAHPEVEAQATCTHCGRAICSACAVNVGGKFVCRDCVAAQVMIAPPAPTSETNVLAVVSLLLGVLGLLACACAGSFGGLPVGAAAAVVGYLARQQIAKQPSSGSSKTLATIGIGLGIAEAILSLVVLLALGSVSLLSLVSQSGPGG